MLPVYVINLESSVQRREKVERRLNALNIPYELWPAVDGRQQPHPLFARYDDQKRKRYRRKKLAGGELGCFASHFLLWEKCIERDQAIVVMEDDVYVTDYFREAVETAKGLLPSLHYVRLAGTSLHRRPYRVLESIGRFELIDHVRGPSGTLCYVLDPHAARALVAYADSWFVAVDDYMDRYWKHGVDCYSLMPYAVLVADNDSDIKRNKKEKTSLWGKLLLELTGRIERVRRTLYRQRRREKKAGLIN